MGCAASKAPEPDNEPPKVVGELVKPVVTSPSSSKLSMAGKFDSGPTPGPAPQASPSKEKPGKALSSKQKSVASAEPASQPSSSITIPASAMEGSMSRLEKLAGLGAPVAAADGSTMCVATEQDLVEFERYITRLESVAELQTASSTWALVLATPAQPAAEVAAAVAASVVAAVAGVPSQKASQGNHSERETTPGTTTQRKSFFEAFSDSLGKSARRISSIFFEDNETRMANELEALVVRLESLADGPAAAQNAEPTPGEVRKPGPDEEQRLQASLERLERVAAGFGVERI
jgi:hypothetical protein